MTIKQFFWREVNKKLARSRRIFAAKNKEPEAPQISRLPASLLRVPALLRLRDIFADVNILRVITLFLFEAMRTADLANQLIHELVHRTQRF